MYRTKVSRRKRKVRKFYEPCIGTRGGSPTEPLTLQRDTLQLNNGTDLVFSCDQQFCTSRICIA